MLSTHINKHHLKRIDFSGKGTGLLSLNSPYRKEAFYRDLPKLIERIVKNELSEKQQGFYDIIDEVCDFSSARKNQTQPLVENTYKITT